MSSDELNSSPRALPSGESRGTRWTYSIEYNPSIPSVPEFFMLGYDEIRKALPLFHHEHPGCYEFVLVERGKANWELDGKVYETQAGQVFHTRPGEKHRGEFNAIEPCVLWWVILKAPQTKNWLRLPMQEIERIDERLKLLPRIIQTGLAPVDALRKLKLALNPEHPYRSTAIRHGLLDIVLSIIQPVTSDQEVAEDLSRQYDRLISQMVHEPEWRPSVDELARAAGVSPSHFYRTFQKHTGEAPITFVERLRIKSACRLLSESQDPITAIAFRLGYPSSQHFATVFKRFMGMTPTAWRKLLHEQGVQE
ncbi:hypothetical protein SY83_02865 [Paenibacillus swuensis]|uniref:HTH araC/xylS-type domain-containing protein n=1 Tax=Paenibacillus swuensis TaxID=1178515 RepID=A0A172TEF9_9BACL|nr:AraC family transcriptional regulator [Paenibacillus swuensis]ANE45439.1 hypothetical protein SY83_02865 [Paenibacillus swuensis]